jgi:hypothetical protein
MLTVFSRLVVCYLVALGLWSLPFFKSERCQVAKTLIAPIGALHCKN